MRWSLLIVFFNLIQVARKPRTCMSLYSLTLSARSQLWPKLRHQHHLRRILSPCGDQCHLNQYSLDRNQAKLVLPTFIQVIVFFHKTVIVHATCMFIFIFLVFGLKFLQRLAFETPQEKCGISMWTVLVLAIVAWHWTEALHQIWGRQTIVSFCSAKTSCCFNNCRWHVMQTLYKSTSCFFLDPFLPANFFVRSH